MAGGDGGTGDGVRKRSFLVLFFKKEQRVFLKKEAKPSSQIFDEGL
jgi:hypothetical protein